MKEPLPDKLKIGKIDWQQKGDAKRREDGIKYIFSHFQKRNTGKNYAGNDKTIYMHVTNATDKEIIEKVFLDVQHILLSQSLEEAGFM